MSALCIRAAITDKSIKNLIKLLESKAQNKDEIATEFLKLK
jgi:hypothetical protein